MQSEPPRISVIGIGNVLLGDDAVGPHVIAWLEANYVFGPNVELCDAGTPGLDMMVRLSQADALIAIDAVRADAPAGSVVAWGREALLEVDPGLRMSPHDPALWQALSTLELAGCAPKDVLLVGVVPCWVEPAAGLSPEVRGAIGGASQKVVETVRRFGGRAERRAPGAEPNTWWERPPRAP